MSSPRSSVLPAILSILAFLCALACGGGGGGSGAVAPAGTPPPDLAPALRKGQKWVHDLVQGGETSRLAVEITAVDADRWTELRMVEGRRLALAENQFAVSGGRTMLLRVAADTGETNYASPGKRAQVALADMPFDESYTMSWFGSSGLGMANIRNAYRSLGLEALDTPLGRVTAEKYRLVSEWGSGSTWQPLETRVAWRSDTYGTLREESTPASGTASVQALRAFTEDAAAGFVREGGRARQAGLSASLSIPDALAASVTDAEARELLALAETHAECRGLAGLDVALAQAVHLYRRYYLYPSLLPASLEGLATARAYGAALQASDQFTYYLNPEQYQRLLEQSRGERAAIGLRLQVAGDAERIDAGHPLTVAAVQPFSRGWFDGVQAGDAILALDGATLDGLSLKDALARFPSAEAAKVRLSVSRAGATRDIDTAAENHIAFMADARTAYLNVRQFTDLTGYYVQQDFDALQKGRAEPIGRLILDLRDDPGGKVSGALALADALIDRDTPKGTNPIYKTRTGASYLGDYGTKHLGAFSAATCVVLVNSTSASASEITVAALRHYGVATALGERTYGKGVSQFLFGLLDGGGVAVTSQDNFAPDGSSYHRTGIAPDIQYTTPAASPAADPQLQAALAYLSAGRVAKASAPPAPAPSREPRPDPLLLLAEPRW